MESKQELLKVLYANAVKLLKYDLSGISAVEVATKEYQQECDHFSDAFLVTSPAGDARVFVTEGAFDKGSSTKMFAHLGVGIDLDGEYILFLLLHEICHHLIHTDQVTHVGLDVEVACNVFAGVKAGLRVSIDDHVDMLPIDNFVQGLR